MGLELPGHQLGGGLRLDGTAGDDRLAGAGGNDLIRGLQGDDLLVGNGGDDRLSGGKGSDQLRGGAGEDALFGGRGHDRLTGGPGDDWLWGGRGRDAFVFHADGGSDRVADFELGKDSIWFEGGPFEDLRDLRAASGQADRAVLIALDAATVRIDGLRIEDLGDTAFVFA
jgi:Ca2+-binding RTX toxin-like protein